MKNSRHTKKLSAAAPALWAAPEAAGFTPGHLSTDGYVNSAEALAEFWEKDNASGQQLDPAAFDQFHADISDALRNRALMPIAQKNGETMELDAKWAKPSGLDSLWDGVVSHVGLSPLYMRMAGAPIYFRRAEWERWIATWEAIQRGEPISGEKPTSSQREKASPRRRGPPARQRNIAADWIAKHYSNSVPEGITVIALQAEMKANGVAPVPSEDTIRRALGRKK